MSDKLDELLAFVRIAETGSLSSAAADLNQSLSVVSRRLSRLEERLGVRLVNRTTRRLSLTDEGLAFHLRAARILNDLEEAEAEVAKGRDAAVGLLRMTSTYAFSRHRLAPLVAEFAARHPGLRVHLDASDRVANLVDEGFDVAIRFGEMADSSLVTRSIANNAYVMCATPAYLDRRGRPQTPGDLAAHDCILFGTPPADRWSFGNGSSVRVGGTLTTNDGDLAHEWALTGAGIVRKSIWDAFDDISARRLEIVLPAAGLPATPLRAVFPHSRLAAAKVRLMLDFLAKELRTQWERDIAPLMHQPSDAPASPVDGA